MKLQADTLLIKLQLLTLAGIVVTQTLGRTDLSSMLFTLTFVLTVALWLVTAAGTISTCDLLVLLILIASGISVAVNGLVTSTVVSPSYFKKLIMFWATILFFGAMGKHRPEREEIRFLFRWNSSLTCFLIGMYFARNGQMHLLNGFVTGYLTFRFTNPNLTAVFLSAMCMIELIRCAASGKRMQRLWHTLLAGVLLLFVMETRARNAQLLLAFFLLIYLFLQLFTRAKPQMRGWMAAVTVTFPLVFALGYLLLIYTPSVQHLFSFLIGEGKDLDSRVGIWSDALRSFGDSPLVGAYSQISGGTGASQMHNSHLDILASYGAPVLGLVCLLLFHVLHGEDALRKGRIHFLCQAGFGALLLSGIGEAMLFSGGMGVYLFAGALLMLTNFDFEGKT